MTLKNRLLITLFIVGMVPVTVISMVSVNQAKHAIEQKAFAHLQATKALKKQSVERYLGVISDQISSMSRAEGTIQALRDFTRGYSRYASDSAPAGQPSTASLENYYAQHFQPAYREATRGQDINLQRLWQPLDDNSVALQAAYLANNPHPLGEKDKLQASPSGHPYDRAHIQWHPFYQDYLKRFGYYDIFLISADGGNIVYSVFKEIDYATSLESGPYSESGLALAYRKAMELSPDSAPALIDFSAYLPSYDAPAGFLSLI
ncbi:MAG TPA: hypothetical protein VFM78_06535 [Marinobacter sp.]|nr:hypothetical protein [Marinobacter sp.]